VKIGSTFGEVGDCGFDSHDMTLYSVMNAAPMYVYLM